MRKTFLFNMRIMRELIDWYRVFDRIPEIMGLELVRNGKMWCGRYYINGDVHPFRADKLKCKIYQSMVFVYEQGGESLSLPEWLHLRRGEGLQGGLRQNKGREAVRTDQA